MQPTCIKTCVFNVMIIGHVKLTFTLTGGKRSGNFMHSRGVNDTRQEVSVIGDEELDVTSAWFYTYRCSWTEWNYLSQLIIITQIYLVFDLKFIFNEVLWSTCVAGLTSKPPQGDYKYYKPSKDSPIEDLLITMKINKNVKKRFS